MQSDNTTFPSLFRKYRLRSELATLSQFGTALSDEGVVYEDSLYCRWQNGTRIPHQRPTLIAMLRVFAKRMGITTTVEVNEFLASAGQRDATAEELATIPLTLTASAFTVPPPISDFVGREKIIKDVCWQLLNSRSVVLYGMAGVGKTAIALYCGHFLRDRFKGGVLWYRCDVKSAADIINDIGRKLGRNVSKIFDISVKIGLLQDVLRAAGMLIILDNIDDYKSVGVFFQKDIRVPVLVTSKRIPPKLPNTALIAIDGFMPDEVTELAERIFGRAYTITHAKSISKIARRVSYSPLAMRVIFKQTVASPFRLKQFLTAFSAKSFKPEALFYDNKNLKLSLEFSFNALSESVRDTCLTLAVFGGGEFSLHAVSFLCDKSPTLIEKETKILEALSFLEKSIRGYRIHPFIQTYLFEKKKYTSLYRRLVQYYITTFQKGGRANRHFYPYIEEELDNIRSLLTTCKKLGFWREIVALWEYVGVFFWDSGRWGDVQRYGDWTVLAAFHLHDDRARARCLIRDLSWLRFWEGDISGARRHLKEGDRLAQSIHDSALEAVAAMRWGKIYQSINPKKALTYFSRALNYFLEQKDYEKQGDILTYIGETYWLMGQRKQARKNLYRALRIVTNIRDFAQKTTILSRLGGMALQERKWSSTFQFFRRSHLAEKESGRHIGDTFWNDLAIGLLYFLKGEDTHAKEKFLSAVSEMDRVGYTEQILAIDVFPVIFRKQLEKSGFFTIWEQSRKNN